MELIRIKAAPVSIIYFANPNLPAAETSHAMGAKPKAF
jgi:hypothetical protein